MADLLGRLTGVIPDSDPEFQVIVAKAVIDELSPELAVVRSAHRCFAFGMVPSASAASELVAAVRACPALEEMEERE